MNTISSFIGTNFQYKNQNQNIVVNWINLNFVGTGTAAGAGTGAAIGDGGLSSAAEINNPAGVACDSLNNLYITEWDGHRVRKVDANTGIITTICGNGTASSTGDGYLATSATVKNPGGIAVDNSFNVYIAEFLGGSNGNGQIRRIDASSGIIYTIANNAVNGNRIFLPLSLIIDSLGSLVITNAGNGNYVKLINPSILISPTTPTLLVSYSTPSTTAVAINPSTQQLFANDWYNSPSFGYYNISGGVYTSFNNLGTYINNAAVRGIALNAYNNIYVICTDSKLYISQDSSYNSNFITFSKYSSLNLSISNYALNPCFDSSNNFYIPNSFNNTIVKVTNITT